MGRITTMLVRGDGVTVSIGAAVKAATVGSLIVANVIV
jgi:hypothetical protein